jgi:hypothetical protein
VEVTFQLLSLSETNVEKGFGPENQIRDCKVLRTFHHSKISLLNDKGHELDS